MTWKIATGLSLAVLVAITLATASADQCTPTPEDELGPLYTPGAPLRNIIGSGYLLLGTVKSAGDCQPLAGASIEIWMAGPQGQYGDDWRATLFSTDKGTYFLRSHPPPDYGTGRPHIHLKVTAAGFKPLTTQHYPVKDAGEGMLDLVLVPAREEPADR